MPFIDRGYDTLSGRRKRQKERMARLKAGKSPMSSARNTPERTPSRSPMRSRAGSGDRAIRGKRPQTGYGNRKQGGNRDRKFNHDYSNVRKVNKPNRRAHRSRPARDTYRVSTDNERPSVHRVRTSIPFGRPRVSTSKETSVESAGKPRTQKSQGRGTWRKQPKALKKQLSTIMSQSDLLRRPRRRSSAVKLNIRISNEHSRARKSFESVSTVHTEYTDENSPRSPRKEPRPTTSDPDVKQVLDNLPYLWQANAGVKWGDIDDDEMFKPNVTFGTLVHVAKWIKRLQERTRRKTKVISRKGSIRSIERHSL